MLERFRDMRVTAVRVRRVEEAKAVVVPVEEEFGQAVHAQRRLVRVVAHAHCARAHRQQARLDARFAQRDRFVRFEFARERRKWTHSPGATDECGGEQSRSCGTSGAMEEDASLHGDSLGEDAEIVHYYGRARRCRVSRGEKEVYESKV